MARVVLDITRSLSRLGRAAATGIDRVETALWQEIESKWPESLVSATWQGRFYVLDRANALRVLQTPDASGWLGRRLLGVRLRRAALAHAKPADAGAALKALGARVWVNVGHTGLTGEGLHALGEADISRVIMVHDVIPLDHPEWSRAKPAEMFKQRMRAVADHADRVIYPSHASRRAAEAHFARFGRVPSASVVPHGPTRALQRPPTPNPTQFLAIGTVEPRKGYDLLCDVWSTEDVGDATLTIVGQRGWADDALYARIKSLATVTWREDASDATLETLLLSSRALLFPSAEEGAGLPAAEALCAGVPVIASDLPVFRELYGDALTYVPEQTPQAWANAVRAMAHTPAKPVVPPRFSWRAHIDLIEREERR